MPISEELTVSALNFLEPKDAPAIEKLLENLHPVELVELIESAPKDSWPDLIKCIKGLDQLSGIFVYGGEIIIQESLNLIDETRVLAVARRIEPDNAANLLRNLSRRKQIAILKRLNPKKVKKIKTLLAYDQEMAGAIMTPLFVDIKKESSCDQVLKSLRNDLQTKKIDPDTDITYLYVTSKANQLLGVSSLREILSAPPSEKISNIMTTPVIKVSPETDQEEVAQLITDYNFSSIPVCSEEENCLLGIITLDDVVDVIEEETTEDILKLAGTEDEDQVGASVVTAIKSRLPWLLASCLGGIAGAMLLKSFTAELEKVLALAFFMPVVFGMGGNVASQATIITVRGIATGDLSSWQTFTRLGKELRTSIFLGIFFGLILAASTWLMFNDFKLCLVVSSSIILVTILAASIGSMLPVFFQKINIDPAVASGPLVTTSTDLISIIIYFAIAGSIL